MFDGMALLFLLCLLAMHSEGRPDRCEAIDVPMCRNVLPYEATLLPNEMGHETQDEASLEIHQFWPLVEVGCSPELRAFLCAVYLPPCNESWSKASPCRSLCLSSRSGCQGLMTQYGFSWPETLDCSKFPLEGEEGLCVGTAAGKTSPPPPPPSVATPSSFSSRCEAIRVPYCRGLSYDLTLLPNALGHRNQERVSQEMSGLEAVLRTQCSPHLRSFLCAILVPPCAPARALPCRSLCLSVRSGCEALLNGFGLHWPGALECGSLPEESCVGPVDAMTPTDDISSSVDAMTPIDDANQSSRDSRLCRCEEVQIPMCREVPYAAMMPNVFGHATQEEADLELRQFWPLVESNCSQNVRELLCSLYVPVCSNRENPMSPCRALCLSAMTGCERVMESYGLAWPVDCEELPDGGLCLSSNDADFDSTSHEDSPVATTPSVESGVDGYITTVKSTTPGLVNSTISAPTSTTNPADIQTQSSSGRCEDITIPLCQDLPYNSTILPNLLHHRDQEEAGLEVHQFHPLVKLQCSPELKLFLCSIYVPPCTILERPLLPCRSLCLSARMGCEPLMIKYGFSWPDSLSCDKVSADPDNKLCIG